MLNKYKINDDVEIRLATLSDLDDIIDIENSSFDQERWTKSEYKKYIKNKRYCFRVLTKNKSIIGFFLFYIGTDKRYAHIDSIAIKEEYRGLGYGQAIMDTIIWLCNDLNRPGIKLEVSSSNTAAVNLYKNLNFSIITQIDDYYDVGTHALVMKYTFMDRSTRVGQLDS